MENTLPLAMASAERMLHSMPPASASQVIDNYRRREKTPILIYSWHTFEQSGGFDWVPASDDNLNGLLDSLEDDVIHGREDHGIVISLSVFAAPKPWTAQDREDVTDYIDCQILDLIETGQIGHIHARYTTA